MYQVPDVGMYTGESGIHPAIVGITLPCFRDPVDFKRTHITLDLLYVRLVHDYHADHRSHAPEN